MTDERFQAALASLTPPESFFCVHSVQTYMRCPKCYAEARDIVRTELLIEAFDRMTDVLEQVAVLLQPKDRP